MAHSHVLERCQVVPRPLADVFPFYADPRNLARITPPWLGLRLVTAGDLTMRAGLRIDYIVRLLGVPQRWTSEITEWEPPRRFTDEQRRGPYRRWRHVHTFREVPDGTEIRDVVTYQLPFGLVGRLVHRLLVRRQLETIFDFRERAVRELFRP